MCQLSSPTGFFKELERMSLENASELGQNERWPAAVNSSFNTDDH